MKHAHKVRLARKLRTNLELKQGTPLFKSEAWLKRKQAIFYRPFIQQMKYWRRQEIVCKLLIKVGQECAA